jgi:hypothetical protein
VFLKKIGKKVGVPGFRVGNAAYRNYTALAPSRLSAMLYLPKLKCWVRPPETLSPPSPTDNDVGTHGGNSLEPLSDKDFNHNEKNVTTVTIVESNFENFENNSKLQNLNLQNLKVESENPNQNLNQNLNPESENQNQEENQNHSDNDFGKVASSVVTVSSQNLVESLLRNASEVSPHRVTTPSILKGCDIPYPIKNAYFMNLPPYSTNSPTTKILNSVTRLKATSLVKKASQPDVKAAATCKASGN